jgi:Tfp pilus assembly protein PilO
MKPLVRILMFLMPIVVGGVMLIMNLSANERLQKAEQDQAALELDRQNLESLMEAMILEPDPEKVPGVARSEEEQARFIEDLKELARTTGCRIDQFTTLPPPPPMEDSILARYHELPTRLVLIGSYEALREFAYAIMRSDRLMNMMNVRWDRVQTGPLSRLTMTITRYGIDPVAIPIPVDDADEVEPADETVDDSTEEMTDDADESVEDEDLNTTSDETSEDDNNESA